jgi:hypothetical protein
MAAKCSLPATPRLHIRGPYNKTPHRPTHHDTETAVLWESVHQSPLLDQLRSQPRRASPVALHAAHALLCRIVKEGESVSTDACKRVVQNPVKKEGCCDGAVPLRG